MPTGRWATTVLSHGGHLALHAFVDGGWAVTRGQVSLRAGDQFVIGSREDGQPMGADLEDAMRLAEEAAERVVEAERIAHQGT